MKWYYAEGGKQIGPVEESALDDLVRQGVVREDTLVWREGMAAWQRYAAVRGNSNPGSPASQPIASAAAAAAPGVETRYCSECGRAVPVSQLTTYGDLAVCTQCQPAYSQCLAGGRPGGGRRFGGFWMRFLAVIIDAIIIGVAGMIIRIPLTFAGIGMVGVGRTSDPAQALAALPAIMGLIGLSVLIQMALSMAYEVYFLTTKGATPGKMALGLKVTRADGGPISVGVAVGRFFGKILSGMILWIGFIIAAFDSEKRALHDHLCGTRVVFTR
jgi:uncharacterized RDD family membrane protein YckC